MRRIILTGAPGCGKTTVLKALAARGHAVIAEAATDLIERETARGVADVWRQGDFIDKITALQRDRQIEAAALAASLQFFDRSPICTHALSVFLGYSITAALEAELARVDADRIYQRQALFFDNLGFIEPTVARTISFADAMAFERVHEQSYRKRRPTSTFRWLT